MLLASNLLRYIFIIFFLVIPDIGFAAAKAEVREIIKPPKRVYIFYRGYHFLKETEPLTDFSAGKVVNSRPVESGEVENVEESISKIARLNRPWEEDERTLLKPTCATPYHELVQLYTNSYTTFTSELKDKDSKTRKIFRLEGIEVTTNPFVSTSRLVHQAFRYGSGHKLYGIEDLRRYPDYEDTGKPKNKTIGYVDVYIIPEVDLVKYGIFDVVGNFATGATKLSYHFRKDLTAEMEFIFPFYISRRFHVRRIPISTPNLTTTVPKGLYKGVWLRNIKEAKTTEDRHKVEEGLLSRLETIEQKRIPDDISLILSMHGIQIINSHPFLDGLRLSNFTPHDAKELRRDVKLIEDKIGTKYRNASKGRVTFPVKDQFRATAWALRNFAGRGDQVFINYDVSFRRLNPDIFNLYLENDEFYSMQLRGDFISYSTKPSEEELVDLDDDVLQKVLNSIAKRKVKLILNIENTRLSPRLLSILSKQENVFLIGWEAPEISKIGFYTQRPVISFS